MLSRAIRRRVVASVRRPTQRRCITPAPSPGDGPLMSRRADRALPEIQRSHWRRTFPLFLAVVAACSVAIFNYQKSSSPIIASTLYALRVSPRARALLGDEIYFKHKIPWIRGEMNQMRGRVDIAFGVRGSRAAGVMRFASHRPSSKSLFRTTAWSLEMEDGRVVDLLEEAGADPFRGMLGEQPGVEEEGEEEGGQTRGFRQQGAYNR